MTLVQLTAIRPNGTPASLAANTVGFTSVDRERHLIIRISVACTFRSYTACIPGNLCLHARVHAYPRHVYPQTHVQVTEVGHGHGSV